jgi:hypothetical protein
MKNMINRFVRSAEFRSMIPQFSRMHLTRTFVETGDERCPIAGIWSRLESDATVDEGELRGPAAWRLLVSEVLWWRALLSAPYIFAVE